MHVFFEDDGAFKAGSVLVDNDTSLQVEAASGKRLKIKAANVLLRFAEPSPSALLAEAQTLAAALDPNFLWEVSGEGEFALRRSRGRLFRPRAASGRGCGAGAVPACVADALLQEGQGPLQGRAARRAEGGARGRGTQAR